jgi:hypothetical protein
MGQTVTRVIVLHRCNYCRADTYFGVTKKYIIYNGTREWVPGAQFGSSAVSSCTSPCKRLQKLSHRNHYRHTDYCYSLEMYLFIL